MPSMTPAAVPAVSKRQSSPRIVRWDAAAIASDAGAGTFAAAGPGGEMRFALGPLTWPLPVGEGGVIERGGNGGGDMMPDFDAAAGPMLLEVAGRGVACGGGAGAAAGIDRDDCEATSAGLAGSFLTPDGATVGAAAAAGIFSTAEESLPAEPAELFAGAPLPEGAAAPRFHPGGGTTCTKLPHLGHSRILPSAASSNTFRRARHVVH